MRKKDETTPPMVIMGVYLDVERASPGDKYYKSLKRAGTQEQDSYCFVKIIKNNPNIIRYLKGLHKFFLWVRRTASSMDLAHLEKTPSLVSFEVEETTEATEKPSLFSKSIFDIDSNLSNKFAAIESPSRAEKTLFPLTLSI
ncbi:hypothetical protein PoB_006805200 [Plakobranchus ocellatus]|uniref:Uncharacterized protein n=1 Tax=Plakobranchus ocellatus TaxID=259542 RepID=A0AAV4DBE8_9GAST|nr:hypothetical protein PoB_006805200 [Plakobranchus ocellatus]